MKPYPHDLREQVVRACDEGRGTRQQIAESFGVSTAWIRRLLQRRRETGSFAARPHAGGPPPKMTPQRRDRLAVLVSEQPNATLAELRAKLGAPVHLSTIARARQRLSCCTQVRSAPRCNAPRHTAPSRDAPTGCAPTGRQPPGGTPRYCRRPRVRVKGGRKVGTYPCGSPRCSRQCRAKWARKMGACMMRAFRERPPDKMGRLTASGVDDATLSKAESAFLRRLRYRGHEYAFVREWDSEGRGRHLHLAVRCAGPLTSEEVGVMWRAALESAAGRPGVKETHYAKHVRNPAGLARYLAKDVRDGGEMVPRNFRGRVFSCSRDFLPRPLKQLWQEVREELFGRAEPPTAQEETSTAPACEEQSAPTAAQPAASLAACPPSRTPTGAGAELSPRRRRRR
jgi:transposase